MSYVKFCPRCQTTTAVDAAICPHCGHHFRTHFQPPLSEKTIAMTSVSESERSSDAGYTGEEGRPIFRPRLVLLCAVILAILGLVYGTLSRRTHEQGQRKVQQTASQGFTPYSVTLRGVQGAAIPFATQSSADLRLWDASQSRPAALGDAGAGDDPAHVHLYLSKRILLVPAGTPARVLLEQGALRRIQVLDGPDKGKTGFVSQGHVSLPSKTH